MDSPDLGMQVWEHITLKLVVSEIAHAEGPGSHVDSGALQLQTWVSVCGGFIKGGCGVLGQKLQTWNPLEKGSGQGVSQEK